MKRVSFMWLTVRGSEIDGNMKVDVTTSKYVLKKIDHWLRLKSYYICTRLAIVELELLLALLKSGKRCGRRAN